MARIFDVVEYPSEMKDEIVLVVTDLEMPVMDGLRLHRDLLF